MTSPIVLGTVHGDKIDGHFYETVADYYQQQIHKEVQRLGGALKEAAGHLEDETLAAKFVEIADARPFQWGTVNVRSGPLLSMGRGMQTAAFVDQTDCEWLVTSDTDMTWAADLPEQMVAVAERGATLDDGTVERIQVLSAPVWIIRTARDGTVEEREPNVYRGVTDDNGARWLVKMTAEELAPIGLYRDVACGAALMLIHRDALTTLRDKMDGRPHWWHHLPTPDGLDQYGEDTSFSIRCHEAGIPVYVHSGIKVGHAKTIVQY